jgi:thymidylate synthase
MNMKPYTERTPDEQYKNLLRDILENGIRSKSQAGTSNDNPEGTDCVTLFGAKPMRFDLSNGFPMITERSVKGFWKQAVGEICGFINGARTLEELESFGCKFWSAWATPEKCAKRGLAPGDLGPGSYGAAFHDFPTVEGPTYNQFKNIVEQIAYKPHLKTHFISPWVPQYTIRGEGKQQKVVVCPCHGWLHIRILYNKLYLHMFQRSGDVPVGVPSNMIQYGALTMMLAQVTGYEPGEYIHTISDAHIYVDQIPMVEELLKRETKPFPTMTLTNTTSDLFAFRNTDFELGNDYEAGEPMRDIPVAV